MLNSDLANLMSEYVDLVTYKILISIDNKTYTLQKYHKLQTEYDVKFANEIRLAYNKEYESLLCKSIYFIDSEEITKLTKLTNRYIITILDYLKFLDLFIIEDIKRSKNTSIYSIFEGHINAKFADLQFLDSKAKIEIEKQYLTDKLYFSITCLDKRYAICKFTPLFKLLTYLYIQYYKHIHIL